MFSFAAALLIALAALTFLGGARAALRVWLDYRLRLAFLEKLEHSGIPLRSSEEVDELLSRISGDREPRAKQDYAVTGLALSAFGIGFLTLGWALRVGNLAVGAYYGGIICLAGGLFLASIGFLIRILRARPTRKAPDA